MMPFFFSSRRRHTRSVSAFLLNRSAQIYARFDKTLQVGYANHFYRSAHKFEQICRHRLRRQNVRSEERRVGKECKCPWSPYHEKTNRQKDDRRPCEDWSTKRSQQ